MSITTVLRAAVLLVCAVSAGCTTVLMRVPVPEVALDTGAPYGITDPLIRVWGDTIDSQFEQSLIAQRGALLKRTQSEAIATGKPIKSAFLALSGGGPDGAFGAGLLNGWTLRGDRPQFRVVTGISTGAIVALFAFLGPEYDSELKEIYTTYETRQLVVPTFFSALTGGAAVTDVTGYRALIERYIDEEVVTRLAAEHQEGRALLIGTTNLDAARPVIWSISGIAATGHPDARKLIHDIIQASSAIPAVFPPVLIPVTTPDGRVYDEMHVDGGATQQVMFFSPQFPLKKIDASLGINVDRSLYVVMNNSLEKPYDPVRPRILSIAGAAVSSLLGGAGAGDIYKIFAIAQRDKIDLRVISIPNDFNLEAEEAFDPVYMKALYMLGFEFGLKGDRWLTHPPDYEPWP